MTPKLSIIMPVYNKARYLSTVLQQIKTQSFSEFECIIVDDGSTDGSGEICDRFAKDDNRFIVIHKENGGVSAARNTGLDLATGNYISFIDGDDEITTEYLKDLYDAAYNSGAKLVIGGCLKFWDNSGKTVDTLCPYEGLVDIATVFSSFAQKQYENGIYGYCCNKLIAADVISGIRFNEKIKLAEDLDFYLSIYPKLENIYFLNKSNYLYRQEAENSSALVKDFDIDYFAQLKIQHKIYNMLSAADKLDADTKKLVTKRIYDYVYWSIFYAPISKIVDRCKEMQALDLPPCTSLDGYPFKRRWILKRYFNGSYKTVKFAIKLHRSLKH